MLADELAEVEKRKDAGQEFPEEKKERKRFHSKKVHKREPKTDRKRPKTELEKLSEQFKGWKPEVVLPKPKSDASSKVKKSRKSKSGKVKPY